MLLCCLQPNQIKQTPNTKDYFRPSHPPYKNTSQRIPAPKNQLPNSTKTAAARFFGNIFRQCPVRRCTALFPPGWWSKKKTTQRSWEKNMINSGYWRCDAWCAFKKSDWLACLAATCVMHLCVRLWFGWHLLKQLVMWNGRVLVGQLMSCWEATDHSYWSSCHAGICWYQPSMDLIWHISMFLKSSVESTTKMSPSKVNGLLSY